MKKSIFITCCLTLLSGLTLRAQNNGDTPDKRNRATFGIKAGVNFANVWDEEGQDFEADGKIGFAGGVFIGIPLGTFLGFQPEVLLSQKGFQGSGTLLGFPYSFSTTKTYIDVPLQLQIKPMKYFTVVLGPQYSYLMSEKTVYTYGSNSSAQEEEFENDNIRKNLLGFVGGLDINVSHVVVSGRIGWDFLRNNGDGSSNTPRYKNTWVQFTVGFKI